MVALQRVTLAAAIALSVVASGLAHAAEKYPTKPVQRLANVDFVAAPTTPGEHERVVRADIATFSGVVKLAGLRPK